MTVEFSNVSCIGVWQIEVVHAATGMIEDGKLAVAPRKTIAQVGGSRSPPEDINLLFGMKSLFAQMFGSCNSSSHGLTREAQQALEKLPKTAAKETAVPSALCDPFERHV